MPRRNRHDILYDGCFSHVFTRALKECWIFDHPSDFNFFKHLLLEAKQKHPFGIHHYCLMNTHFHLVVSIPKVEHFSKALKLIKSRYTWWVNQKKNRSGSIWRERFRGMLIENERYLNVCGQYVEWNPVKAGMCHHPVDWPYSSAAHYLLGKKDPLVDPYDRETKTDLPENVDLADDDYFTRGFAVGSKLFRLQVRGKVLSVPLKVSVP